MKTQLRELRWAPTIAIRYHLGRVHIATPDREVLEETVQAARKSRRLKQPAGAPRINGRILRRSLRFAIAQHHRNRDTLNQVSAGRFLIWNELPPEVRARVAAFRRARMEESRELIADVLKEWKD